MIGQTLIAIGNPMILNMPQKLAMAWFPRDMHKLITMLSMNMFIIGTSISFLVVRMIVNGQCPKIQNLQLENTKYTPKQYQDVLDQVKKLMLYSAIFQSFVFILVALFFQNMFFNKFGQCDPDIEKLSDTGSENENTNSMMFEVDEVDQHGVKQSFKVSSKKSILVD